MFELDNLKIYFLTQRLQTQTCRGKRQSSRSWGELLIGSTEIKGPFWVLQFEWKHLVYSRSKISRYSPSATKSSIKKSVMKSWIPSVFDFHTKNIHGRLTHIEAWPIQDWFVHSMPVKRHLHFAMMAWPSCRGSRISLGSRRPMWSTWMWYAGMLHASQGSWIWFNSKFVSCSQTWVHNH